MKLTEGELELISRCPLFEGCGPGELGEMFAGLTFRSRSWEAGRLVMLRGTPYEELLLLLEGRLSAEIGNPSGKVLKVETLAAPTMVAGPVLFSSQNQLPVQLTAETDVRALALPKKDVLHLLQSSDRVLRRFLTDSGNKISFLSEKIRLLQLTNIRQKIASYFLDQRLRQGTDLLTLPYTIEVTAELFSVSRPSLSRSLGELVDEGVLERKGRSYFIADPAALEAELE